MLGKKKLSSSTIALMIIIMALIIIATLLSSCETLSQTRFALDAIQGDTSVSFSYGDGKAVVEAGQGANKIQFVGKR